MHIDYEISEQDYFDAHRLGTRHSTPRYARWMASFLPWLGAIMLASLTFATIRQGFAMSSLPGLCIGVFFLSIPILTKRKLRKLYASTAAMHHPISIDIEDSGMHFSGPTFSSQADWSHFSRFCEDQNVFIVFQNQKMYNMISKRNLSQEQITGLREYLNRYTTPGPRKAVLN